MATETQTRKILIKIDSSGGEGTLKKLSNQFASFTKEAKNMGASVKSAAGSLSFFQNALSFTIAGIGVRELVQAADAFQLLRDRITVFVGSQQEVDAVLKDLATSASFTKTSVEALATSYNRIAFATQDLGISSDAILGITTALQQTFRLSGATIAEATAATIQLSQGLASGQLRGQELRSVLEQNAVIGGILADKLGVTRGQLIKFAETGRITSEVMISALADNFDVLNEKASKLQITIGQAVTIALDKFKIKVDEINREFGISKGIVKGIELLVNNLDLLSAALAGVAVIGFGKLIGALKALSALVIANPYTAAFTAIVVGVTYLYQNWERATLYMSKAWLSFRELFIKGVIFVQDKLFGIDEFLRKLTGQKSITKEDFLKNDKEALAEVGKELEAVDKKLSSFSKKTDISSEAIQRQKDGLIEAKNALAALGSAAPKTLADINKELAFGVITLQEYEEAVDKIQISKLNKDFAEGKIALDNYYSSLIKIEEKFRPDGALFVGTNNYIKQAGTLSQNVADAITKTFSRLEDTLVEFTKKGRFEFSKMARAILEDINRIIIRATIVRPLAEAILNFAVSPSAGSAQSSVPAGATDLQGQTAGYAANGAYFDSTRAKFFASGGVVDSPTIFQYGTRKIGILGEAGPEAILPLRRTPSGDLGVAGGSGSNVQVNIINNASAEVQTEERVNEDGSRVLDVVIVQKVKDAMSRGQFDRVLNQNFGLNRRGG